MRKAIVAMCVLGLLAWAAPASAQNSWVGGTSNDWNDDTNWSTGLQPVGGEEVIIAGAALPYCDVTTAWESCGVLRVGTAAGNGELRLNSTVFRGLYRGDFYMGDGGGTGVVTLNSEDFGQMDYGWAWYIAADGGTGTATFNLNGGVNNARGQVRMGSGTGSVATVNQTGGFFDMSGSWSHFELNKSRGLATYNISGGRMDICDFLQTSWWGHGEATGADAIFNVTDTNGAPDITFLASEGDGNAWSVGGYGGVNVRNNATVKAVTGTVVHMQGNFTNRMGAYVADPTKGDDATDCDGLNNITLQFERGAANIDTLEVAGVDMGNDYKGLCKNYALEGLDVGGNVVAGGGYQDAAVMLVDAWDNQMDGLAEVLYVQHLEVDATSILNLGGLTLYSYTSNISGTVLNGTHVQLTHIMGDLDLDVDVDWIDYTTLRGNYGTMVGMTWADGDLNGDGAVDWSDYTALRGMYGENACSPAGPGAVPEPITLTLLGLGSLALIRRRRQ